MMATVTRCSGMVSREDHAKWHLRIESAADRYRVARLRVGETAIERFARAAPDGDFAHLCALEEETRALKAYGDLLGEYSRIVLSTEGNER